MNTLLTERYILMYKTQDDDVELAFNVNNKQLEAFSLEEAKHLVFLHQQDFDFGTVIPKCVDTFDNFDNICWYKINDCVYYINCTIKKTNYLY